MTTPMVTPRNLPGGLDETKQRRDGSVGVCVGREWLQEERRRYRRPDTRRQHAGEAQRHFSEAAQGLRQPLFSVHYEDAYKTLREAEDYKPGVRTYYVRELSDHRNEYLLAGISPSERKQWLTSHRIAEKDQQCLVPLFDEIGAAAKRTLPKYHPRGYVHHDSDEEKLMREVVKNEFPDAEVLHVGISSPSWQIEKLNNGTPSSRYKYGMAWVKSATFDDGYCRIMYINVLQDYAGGGTYADTHTNYISLEPAGCT